MTEREIKFRVWDKENEFMYPDYHTTSGTLNEVFWMNDDYVFMQYTGLKDKNGEEIYEYDIVSDHGKNGSLAICLWDIAESDDVEVASGFRFFSLEDYPTLLKYQLKNKEVVGNAWQNPELLGPKFAKILTSIDKGKYPLITGIIIVIYCLYAHEKVLS